MKKSDILWNALLFSTLLGYFLLMKVLGLHQILSLRYLNLVFHFGIIYLAMRQYRAHIHSPGFSFLDTGMVGIRASVPAILLFAVFQFVYLRFLNPDFMQVVISNSPMGLFMSPAIVAVALAAEGLVATFFNSYVAMRLIAGQEKAAFPKL